ncbi:hypothetical protein FBY26_1330 [Phycicoccus sp. SLBN-51]|nr:hypothetical protein FBY26_1330 [Phycicoccus sp. SLBN-51]
MWAGEYFLHWLERGFAATQGPAMGLANETRRCNRLVAIRRADAGFLASHERGLRATREGWYQRGIACGERQE